MGVCVCACIRVSMRVSVHFVDLIKSLESLDSHSGLVQLPLCLGVTHTSCGCVVTMLHCMSVQLSLISLSCLSVCPSVRPYVRLSPLSLTVCLSLAAALTSFSSTQSAFPWSRVFSPYLSSPTLV